MLTFDYRLVEHHYHNTMEWEDGPGSLRNVVSKRRSRVVRTWEARNEEFERRLLSSGLVGLELDSDDGWDEYSYYLERRSSTGEDWKFVGIVEALPEERG